MSASSDYYLLRNEKALSDMQDIQDGLAIEQDKDYQAFWNERNEEDQKAQDEAINPKISPF